jgi:drug/metabolite transporter (DMT)-like permease
MITWFIFALLSVFVLAGSEISQKISITQKKINLSAITNNFYVWTLQGTFGLIIAFFLNQIAFDFSLSLILKLIAIGIVYFLGGTFFYTSYKGNSPSISVILGSISVIISTALGIIFFDESTTLLKFAGILLILTSIVILNYSKKEKMDKYNMYALIGGACFGIAYTIDKSFIFNISPYMYVALMSFSVAIVSFVLRSSQIISESKRLKKENYYPMIMSASFGTLFNLFTFLSYSRGGNVGVVDAMNNSSVFLIIIVEVILLKDRSSLRKKIICSLLAFAGIAIFAWQKM